MTKKAVITQKKFADQCGITLQDLRKYRTRGKVVLTEDKKIDTSHEANASFLKHREHLLAEKERGKESKLDLERYHTDRSLKKAEVRKKIAEAELAELKLERQKGEAIPTEMVRVVFAQHNKDIAIEMDNALDRVMTRVAKEYGVDAKGIAKYRGAVRKDINKAVDDALKRTETALKDIIKEFSQKRGQGERK